MVKEYDFDQAAELIRSAGAAEDVIDELDAFDETGGSIFVYENNVQLPELKVGADIIKLKGDLDIAGTLEDCEKADSSLLIVLGNLSCRNLINLGSMHVTGNVNVEQTILGDSLCDYSLSAGGNISARTILDNGHHIVARGRIHVQDLYSFHSVEDENGRLEPNLDREELVPQLLRDGNPDLPRIIHYIAEGGTQFRRA